MTRTAASTVLEPSLAGDVGGPLEPPGTSLGRSEAARRRGRHEMPLRGEVGARSPRRDRVPIPRFDAALFRGGRPRQRPFQRTRCRTPRRRPPQRAARVPPPPRSPERHSRADTPSHRGPSSSSEPTVVAATIGPYDVACDVPKRPAKPAFTRRVDSRDHDDGIEATWDAVDAVDATTSSSRFRLPSPWY